MRQPVKISADESFILEEQNKIEQGHSGKFRYEALALKCCLVIFHDLTQCHTNPSSIYVHDFLKGTYNIKNNYKKIGPYFLGIFTSEIILQISTAIHSEPI